MVSKLEGTLLRDSKVLERTRLLLAKSRLSVLGGGFGFFCPQHVLSHDPFISVCGLFITDESTRNRVDPA